MKTYFTLLFIAISLHCAAETPLEQAKAAFQQGDTNQAIKLWKQEADKGNAKAQYNLALVYLNETDGQQNRTVARSLLEQAAAKNLPEAQYELGQMLLYGEKGITTYSAPSIQAQNTPTSQEREQGIVYITRAAEQGLPLAIENIATIYDLGIGVAEDNSRAVMWYKKAAEQGNADAQYNLALHYLKGEGTEKNCEQAIHWLTQAAEQKDWAASEELAKVYVKGECVTKDAVKAEARQKKAATYPQPKPRHNRTI
ncbi:MAG: tetratricopeptide repeat protein [Cardiobacteriaceae bacterium]|nr:tetratricopeptide repeat protein [Cardiobacteriaceae bacterium]